MIRQTLFWLHLAAGLTTGLVVATMSFTGAALAFKKELVAWDEHDARRVTPPAGALQHVALTDLLARAREKEPETRPTAISLFADPNAAVAISFGRENTYYADPYTGELRKPSSTRVRDLLQAMEGWHRFLGQKGESSRLVGKAVTGACNLCFLFLALSGLCLWWPRNWSWRGLKAIAVFNFKLAGKARDFNWHNSFGLWTAPILIVLTLTAIPLSYRWGTDLLFKVTGTEPSANPQYPAPGATATAVTGSKPLSLDALLARVQAAQPSWTEISFLLGNTRGPAASQRREDRSVSVHLSDSGEQVRRSPQNVTVTVRTAEQRPLFSTTTLTLDPFTGEIVKTETFADQNAGRRLRLWARFLHTGEALGTAGKWAALLASLGAVVLCWTGIALSWRRFFRKQPA